MISVLIAVFVATMAFVVGGYVLINRKNLEAAEAARARLGGAESPDRVWNLLKDDRISEVPFLNRLLSGKEWVTTVKAELDRAGWSMRPANFLLLASTSGLFGILLGLRTQAGFPAFLFFVAGFAAPILWLKWQQKRRVEQFEEQLPDAIEMLVSSMKAGYSFQAASKFIGDELPAPLGPEFSRFYDEQRLGIDVRTALLGMQSRIDSLDFKLFVTAVLIQRETGGNLGEVLSNLADLVRERIAMRSQIQTLVAEPKLSARFLAVLPVMVFALISFLNPRFFDPMTAQGSGGRLVLITAAASVVIGYFIMMKIADIDL